MFDPLQRWRELGLPDKPDYAGLLTFAGLPTTQDPAELEGVDVAIVGAPMDDLTSDRPGHAVRSPCHSRGGLSARTAPGGAARWDRRAPRRRLRRRPGRARRSGGKPRCDRAPRRSGRCGRRDPDRPRRRSLDLRAGREGSGGGSRPGRSRPLRHPYGHGRGGLRRRGLARDADVPARARRPCRRDALRADRAQGLLAGRARVRLAGRARDHELLHARRSRPRDSRSRRGDDRNRRRGAACS